MKTVNNFTVASELNAIHVVTGWLGNTASVAAKHYLQLTEAHYEKAVQNPVQQAAAKGCSSTVPSSTPSRRTVC